jgi:hypothetical protein
MESPNGHAVEVQIPVIALSNMPLRVTKEANGNTVLLMGPMMLALPVDDDARRALVEALTGIAIPGGPVS